MEEEENFQKAEAMICLMCELNAGIRSAEEKGWISEDDFRKHFHNKILCGVVDHYTAYGKTGAVS